MKKLLLVVAGIALLAVACRAEVNVLVDINQDRSGSATFEFGLDDEFKNLIESSGGSTEDLLADVNLAAEGGEATTRTEGDMTYTGVRKDFTDVDEILGDLTGETNSDGPFTDFSFDMDDKTAELTATISAPEQDAGDLPIDPSTITDDIFSSNFILSMPGNVVEHNADEVLPDGRLRWDLPILGGTKEVHAVSEFGGSSLWWLWIVLGVVLIVGVIAIIAAVFIGRRQQREAVNDAAAQYPEPAVVALGVDEAVAAPDPAEEPAGDEPEAAESSDGDSDRSEEETPDESETSQKPETSDEGSDDNS